MIKSAMNTVFFLVALTSAVVANAATQSDMANTMNQVKTACASDLKTYCSDVTAGGNKQMACLKAHEDQLSQGCATQWNQAKAAMKDTWKQARNACAGDVQKFCANSTGHKEVASCLQDHMSDLSNSCKTFQQSHQMSGQMSNQMNGSGMDNSQSPSDVNNMNNTGAPNNMTH